MNVVDIENTLSRLLDMISSDYFTVKVSWVIESFCISSTRRQRQRTLENGFLAAVLLIRRKSLDSMEAYMDIAAMNVGCESIRQSSIPRSSKIRLGI